MTRYGRPLCVVIELDADGKIVREVNVVMVEGHGQPPYVVRVPHYVSRIEVPAPAPYPIPETVPLDEAAGA